MLSCLISILLIFLGIKGVAEKNESSVIWIIFGLILPLIVSISMYPIFALANIDENINCIKQTLNERGAMIQRSTTTHETQSPKNIIDTPKADSNGDSSYDETKILETVPTDRLKDIVDFINKKYDIEIEVNDSLETIKLKIANI